MFFYMEINTLVISVGRELFDRFETIKSRLLRR